MEIRRGDFLRYAGAAVATGTMLSFLASCGGTEQATPTPEPTPPRPAELNADRLRAQIRSYRWEDLQNADTVQQITQLTAATYLTLSPSSLVTQASLIAGTEVYWDREHFINRIHSLAPAKEIGEGLAAFTHLQTGKLLFDISNVKKYYSPSTPFGGQLFMQIGLHEYTHIDTKVNTEGSLLNNGKHTIIDKNGEGTPWKFYRGGLVLVRDEYGLGTRFDEVWTDTLMGLGIQEALGLSATDPSIIYSGSYKENGTNLFVPLVEKMGISRFELSRLHQQSQFEELVRRIGQVLPGKQNAIDKGLSLVDAIIENDSALIAATGVRNILGR